jgi:hypothetical protein
MKPRKKARQRAGKGPPRDERASVALTDGERRAWCLGFNAAVQALNMGARQAITLAAEPPKEWPR